MYSALEKEFHHNEKMAEMSLLSACHHQTIRSAFIHLPGQHPTPNTQRPELIANCGPLVVRCLSRSISASLMLKMTLYHWCYSPLLSRAHCCTGHQFESKLKSAADMAKTLQGHRDRIKLDFME